MLEIPFNSVRRYQLVVANCIAANQPTHLPPLSGEDGEPEREQWTYCVMVGARASERAYSRRPPESFVHRAFQMKGAPEVVLSRCSHVAVEGELVEVDDDFMKQAQVEFASKDAPQIENLTIESLRIFWQRRPPSDRICASILSSAAMPTLHRHLGKLSV